MNGLGLTYEAPKLDEAKLRDTILYICSKVKNPRDLGRTKLNKILFYSDQEAYIKTGQPITGERYVKHQYGPVSHSLNDQIARLKKDQLLAESKQSRMNWRGEPYEQFHYNALERPSLDKFNAEEISILDDYIFDICSNHSAASISEKSHDFIWEAAEIGEELPYFMGMLRLAISEVTPSDKKWAEEMLEARNQ
jgi:uncharacterized phage-associated protein